MKKLKVVTIVGTRPEIIRLSRVIAMLDRHCNHVLVHTGQNYDYELNQIFFDDLGVRKPDHFLDSAGSNAAETIGNVIAKVDRVFSEIEADAMLVLGDTNSCLAVIPAKRRRIPVFHMEAGNRCFDQRVPEEINRRIVDHTADVNLTYSTIARDYLLREGLPPDLVIKTGSPMYEVLTHYRPKIDASDVLARLKLSSESYFVVSAHREENIETPSAFARLVAVLNAVAEDHGLPVIVSRIGGLPELVAEGENGFLFDPQDYHALAANILTLVADKDLRQRMGKNGREKAVERHNLKKNVAKWVEMLVPSTSPKAGAEAP